VTRDRRINIELDAEHAAKLTLLAERAQRAQETVARLLLAEAIDEADVNARNVVELLDDISGAFEHARLGLEHAHAGRTIPLDEL
jgi:hypothetical protein